MRLRTAAREPLVALRAAASSFSGGWPTSSGSRPRNNPSLPDNRSASRRPIRRTPAKPANTAQAGVLLGSFIAEFVFRPPGAALVLRLSIWNATLGRTPGKRPAGCFPDGPLVQALDPGQTLDHLQRQTQLVVPGQHFPDLGAAVLFQNLFRFRGILQMPTQILFPQNRKGRPVFL